MTLKVLDIVMITSTIMGLIIGYAIAYARGLRKGTKAGREQAFNEVGGIIDSYIRRYENGNTDSDNV